MLKTVYIFQSKQNRLTDWGGRGLKEEILPRLRVGHMVRLVFKDKNSGYAEAIYVEIVGKDSKGQFQGKVQDFYRHNIPGEDMNQFVCDGEIVTFDPKAITEIPVDWEENKDLDPEGQFFTDDVKAITGLPPEIGPNFESLTPPPHSKGWLSLTYADGFMEFFVNTAEIKASFSGKTWEVALSIEAEASSFQREGDSQDYPQSITANFLFSVPEFNPETMKGKKFLIAKSFSNEKGKRNAELFYRKKQGINGVSIKVKEKNKDQFQLLIKGNAPDIIGPIESSAHGKLTILAWFSLEKMEKEK